MASHYTSLNSEGKLVVASSKSGFGKKCGTASTKVEKKVSKRKKHSEASRVAYRMSRIFEEDLKDAQAAPNQIAAARLGEYTESPAVEPTSYVSAVAMKEDDRPRALVMAHGREARQVIFEVSQGGFCVCAPYTDDRKREGYLRSADLKVSLGERFDEALYTNAYAILKAAEDCQAHVIMLFDTSISLASVDSFLARAEQRGLRVFRPVDPKVLSLGWIACTTELEPPAIDSWRSCSHCGLTFDHDNLVRDQFVCPNCGGYIRMVSNERIDDLLDEGSFVEWDAMLEQSDPLDFPGYRDKLEKQMGKTGLSEAVRTGEGRIAGLPLALGIMESSFFMGSMGSVVGEKLSRMVLKAKERGLPVVIFTCSGGARMQEGLISLMQMAKVSCALSELAEAGLPYISVLTDPTTGGVTASFAMQGDIILAEPKALIGFAGQRVIRDTIKQELPDGFQTAEFALKHGLIDAIVTRKDMRATLAHLLAIHAASNACANPQEGDVAALIDFEHVKANLEKGTDTYNTLHFESLCDPDAAFGNTQARAKSVADWAGLVARQTIGTVKGHVLQRAYRSGRLTMEEHGGKDGKVFARESLDPVAAAIGAANVEDAEAAWKSVQLARNTNRPTACAYLEGMVKGFVELHGDRMFGDDGAIVAGLGWIGGRPVTIIAQEKGAELKERIKRNFGCPQPEGYRKSLRLMKQAEKFGRPIVCLVDTQGAFCGMEAEERGQGNAIAENLIAMASLRVPVVSVLLGEGGSGGALALAVSNTVAMQENAVYSVLSPEGFASILWKDRSRASEAAAVMKMNAAEVCRMEIVDAVISEGDGPAHENPEQAIENVRKFVEESLEGLEALSPEDLVQQRRERFARY